MAGQSTFPRLVHSNLANQEVLEVVVHSIALPDPVAMTVVETAGEVIVNL